MCVCGLDGGVGGGEWRKGLSSPRLAAYHVYHVCPLPASQRHSGPFPPRHRPGCRLAQAVQVRWLASPGARVRQGWPQSGARLCIPAPPHTASSPPRLICTLPEATRTRCPACSPNQRLRARILWVDPASKRVGLTLQRHLLGAGLPPNFPALGQVRPPASCQQHRCRAGQPQGCAALLAQPGQDVCVVWGGEKGSYPEPLRRSAAS